jgi:lipopolysaccharide transport system ATP-binding protein
MLLGFTKQEIENKLDEIFEFAELQEYINFPLHAYSTGMKARLGFSVAHSLDPDILLIDEVLAVGDADFRRKSLEIMQKKLLSEQTIVLISHNAQLVKKLCNRAIWIEHGKMRMESDADSVVRCYESSLNTKSSSKI